MNVRTGAVVGGLLLAAAIAGVATSQQPAPPPNAATQVDLTPTREEAAELARAQQDPLATRFHRQLEQEKDLAGLSAQVAAATVPVLAPPDVAMLKTAEYFNGDRHYMLVIEAEDGIIEIYGATKAFQSPVAGAGIKAAAAPARPARTARLTAARVQDPTERALAQARGRGLTDIRTERTEYGVDVAFRRFGAIYSVSFICETQGTGCAEPDAIAFAAGLVLLNGGGA